MTVKLISYLRQIGGFREKTFAVERPTKIRELVPMDLSDERLVIIINESQGGTMDTLVDGDDTVVIAPIFGGGNLDVEC